MNTRASERVYEDIDPASNVVSEEGCDTLFIHLDGFKKEQLKVQLTVSGILRVSGERPVGGNRWKRFLKEIQIPSDCITDKITAKFENGVLSIRQPKSIAPAPAPSAAAAAAPPPPPLSALPAATAAAPPPPPPLPALPAATAAAAPPPPPLPALPAAAAPPPQLTKEEKPAEPAPMPQPRQETPPRQPQPQPRDSEPQLQELPKKEEAVPPKGLDQGKIGQVDKRKHRRERTTRVNDVDGDGGGFLKELMKPENVKMWVVSVVGVLMFGFYIVYMFKSFAGDGEQT